MRNQFNQVQARRPKKSAFDLSHEKKLSMNMGDLVPIMLQEVLPGDKFQVSSEVLMRLAPMLAPVMHRVNVYTHYFFVPNRIIWQGWENFIGGGQDGDDQTVPPIIGANAGFQNYLKKGSLADYFGIPVADDTPITQGINLNELPFRAYQEIYNEYYRDPNLSNPVPFSKVDPNTQEAQFELMTLRKRAWEKDYFTSAMPWAQRGGEVGTPVDFNYRKPSLVRKATDDSLIGSTQPLESNGTGSGLHTPAIGDLYLDSLEEEGVTVSINELRKSVRLQEWLEKNARGGYRYLEQLLHHWGVISSDARLQRPEYLGGGRQPITISEVLQTSATVVDGELPHENLPPSPQGNMSGHGISVGRSNRFKKRFEEHGHVIGIMSVLPRTTYQNGLERMWSREDKFKYAWPEFAQLGEQEILSREVYHDWQNPNISDTFGYQSRYAEYKYKQSTVHGDFRDSLYYWHMGRIFESRPVLNEAFVTSDPTQRIFNVDDEEVHKLYVQIYNSVKAIRPLPFFNTPTL